MQWIYITRGCCISGRDIPIFLVGDSAYPLMTWLMKPFAHNTADQLRENIQLQAFTSSYCGRKCFWKIKGPVETATEAQ